MGVVEMFGRRRRKRAVSIPSGREAAFPFIMECFLKSRGESGNPSNVDYYEEDVNIYVASLLSMLLDPVYYVQVQKYVSDYDAGVFDKVRNTSDNRLRYWVYKANADHLLVSLGVFGRGREDEAAPGRHGRETASQAAGRAKTYYDFARSYCELLTGSSSGPSEVLAKLSMGFEKYVRILDHMRGEYFNIIDTLSDGELFHLQREIEQVKEKEYVSGKYDELLDLYLEWKVTGNDNLLAELRLIARELKKLDPSFNFEIPAPVLDV
jgi:hypothetical protein